MKAKLFGVLVVGLCTLGMTGFALAQQLLQNQGFESWTGGIAGPPDNWSLSHGTGISAARTAAPATLIRTGNYSARIRWNLADRSLDQTVNVNADSCYNFSFWARDSVFAPDTAQAAIVWLTAANSPIDTITSPKVQIPANQWKQVGTGNRWAPSTAAKARVEIRVHNSSVGWHHIWVDDAAFYERHAFTLVAIFDVQYNDFYQTWDGKPVGDCFPTLWLNCPLRLWIAGFVTAVLPGPYPDFYMQDAEEEWSGIFVYDASVNPAVGDEVEIEAEVDEYYGMTEMKYVSDFTIHSSGNPLPAPLEISTGDLAGGCNANSEAYEGCLVRVRYVTCTQDTNEFGEWYVDDGSGECQIDDKLFFYSPYVGESFDEITGVVDYSFGEYEILPRDMGDIMVPVELISFEATAGDGRVTLIWETASEVDAHSFNIYRDGEKIASVPAHGEAHSYRYVDRQVLNGITYSYQLSDVDLDGTETIYETVLTATPMAMPMDYMLAQNYPNPFNPVTEIRYALPQRAYITLKVYNLLGQEVIALVDGERSAGGHTVSWNGVDAHGVEVASGIYFYRLETKAFSATKKMVFLK